MWLFVNITKCMIIGLLANGEIKDVLKTLITNITFKNGQTMEYKIDKINNKLIILTESSDLSRIYLHNIESNPRQLTNCSSYRGKSSNSIINVKMCHHSFWSYSAGRDFTIQTFVFLNLTADTANYCFMKNRPSHSQIYVLKSLPLSRSLKFSLKCKLDKNSQCWFGICCNLDTCRYHSSNLPCRTSSDECDLTEYCSGFSSTCPDDEYFVDQTPCRRRGHCFRGKCSSEEIYCRHIHPLLRYNAKHCSHNNSTRNDGNCQPLLCEIPTNLKGQQTHNSASPTVKHCLEVNYHYSNLCGRSESICTGAHCQTSRLKSNCYCSEPDKICTNMRTCKSSEYSGDSVVEFYVNCMTKLVLLTILGILLSTYKAFLEHINRLSRKSKSDNDELPFAQKKKKSRKLKEKDDEETPSAKVTVFKDNAAGDSRFHTLAVMQRKSPDKKIESNKVDEQKLIPSINNENKSTRKETKSEKTYHKKKRIKMSDNMENDDGMKDYLAISNSKPKLNVDSCHDSSSDKLLSSVDSLKFKSNRNNKKPSPTPGKIEYLNFPKRHVIDRCQHNYSYLERKYAMPRGEEHAAYYDYSKIQSNESNLRRRQSKLAKEKTKVDLASKESIAHFVDDNHIMDGIDDVENVVYVVIPNKKRF